MANNVGPAPIGAVCSRSLLFASIFVSNVRQLFAADDFSRRHFQLHFFLGALRVKIVIIFLPFNLNTHLGAEKNHLIETVLLSTHNICFD